MERESMEWTREAARVICKHCKVKGHVIETTWTEKNDTGFWVIPFKDLTKYRVELFCNNCGVSEVVFK